VRTPAFTWWGGALGPRLLNHRVCRACKLGFNAKTRGSNTRAIIIYQVVVFAVAIGALTTLWAWNGTRQVTAFVDGCAVTCAKGGSSPADCQRMCECVATDLRRDGDDNFRRVLTEAARTGTVPREISEAAARCRGQ
jgi:hypothetical protein